MSRPTEEDPKFVLPPPGNQLMAWLLVLVRRQILNTTNQLKRILYGFGLILNEF